jgi:hypothetical protein
MTYITVVHPGTSFQICLREGVRLPFIGTVEARQRLLDRFGSLKRECSDDDEAVRCDGVCSREGVEAGPRENSDGLQEVKAPAGIRTYYSLGDAKYEAVRL